MAFILRHAGAKTLATDSGLAELARAAAKPIPRSRTSFGCPPKTRASLVPGMASFHDLAACTNALPDTPLQSTDLLQLHQRHRTSPAPC